VNEQETWNVLCGVGRQVRTVFSGHACLLCRVRIDPPHGFGHQMLYTADGETVTHTVRDGDAVLLPYGYHPVSAPPGDRVYYLWAIAGAERRLGLYEDPAHQWINQSA
jgi:5-deoxy-glucuronate isomerase